MVSTTFKVGEKVVYPAHGVGVIEGIQTREAAFGLPATWIATDQRDSAAASDPANQSGGCGRCMGTG